MKKNDVFYFVFFSTTVSLTSSENVKGLEYVRHCKADIMPDVMKVLAKEDPFVPSVFENFREASTTSWWKLGLRMGFPEGILQFALSLLPPVCSYFAFL